MRRLDPRRPVIWQPPLFFGLFFAFWQFGVVLLGIKPYLLPRFSAVLVAMWTARADLAQNALVTIIEVITGYLAAVVIGGLLGVFIFVSPFARRTIYPFMTGLQSLPKSALAPLMIVWFGYGLLAKGAMAFLFAFFPIIIATLSGLAGTPANLVEHFHALRASPWQTFVRLRLPSALPLFLDGCKVAMPLAVIGAIIGEFVGSENGLGNSIMMATSSSRTDLMFAAIIWITAVSMAFYAAIDWLSRRAWWRGIQV